MLKRWLAIYVDCEMIWTVLVSVPRMPTTSKSVVSHLVTLRSSDHCLPLWVELTFLLKNLGNQLQMIFSCSSLLFSPVLLSS